MSAQFNHPVLTIDSQFHSYDVVIGRGVVAEYLRTNPQIIVADRRFQHLNEPEGRHRCIFIDAVEGQKTLSTVETVMSELQKAGTNRDSTILAIGGGIIQDVATLTASLYMRGIKWQYAPTTLLAMADSCIGGKSSINVASVKNLIGNIYPPGQIFVDTEFLTTLPPEDIAGGLAEAAKIAFCKGTEDFQAFIDFTLGDFPSNVDAMLTFILQIKKWFIEIDEFDKAERKLLNFGHTFGHALEVGSNHTIGHGLAVAFGMRAALNFEMQSRALSSTEIQLSDYTSSLLTQLNVRWQDNPIDWEKFKIAFDSDKKHKSSEYSLILPNFDGSVRIQAISKSVSNLQRVVEAQMQALTLEVL